MILLVDEAGIGRRTKRPLIATLKAALEAFEDGRSNPALNQLHAFQNKVRAQIAPIDPILADE